jgi:uncharacterized protein (TIGR03118 family)
MTRLRTLFANWASRLAQGELVTALPGRRAGGFRSRRGRSGSRRFRRTLSLEVLEDRTVLSPVVLDPNLGVRTVVSGLTQPTSMVFLGDNNFFVTEKSTGKVDHVINGVNAPTQFDLTNSGVGAGVVPNLPINFNSERGLLGIALSPDFANDHFVYLYWTQNNSGPAPDNKVADVPVLGNRVDRFVWDSDTSTLKFDKNIIQLHAFQNDGNGGNPAQMQGNHNGGVIKFGPDGKLYIVIGDNGRRGWMQNLINGPNGPGQTDENNGPVRGGPAPDDAHLTGVLLRLNPDGTTPDDNPFADIRNSLGAVLTPLPGTQSSGIGSFTAFLDQKMKTLTVIVTAKGLSSDTLAGGADIRFGSPDGPSIFNIPDFPGGVTSGQFTFTLTKHNFIKDHDDGIKNFRDAINAVLSGKTFFTIATANSPDGEVGGKIAQLDPEITANLHKVFAYGIRNTFGYDWDPFSGRLWLEEDGDQSFDKISIVDAGANDGWIQSSAPLFNFDGSPDPGALAEFKAIERRLSPNGMQQTRWPSANIPDTVDQALSQLVMLPGARYNAPVFSERAEVPPAGLGFLNSSALGPNYDGALFEGEARDNFPGSPFRDPREQFDGALFVFHPKDDRTGLDFNSNFGSDPNLLNRLNTDGVLPNNSDFDIKSLYGGAIPPFVLGTNFGVLTDIVTGPDGNLYVVSLSGGDASIGGAVFEVFSKNAVAPFKQTNLVSDIANPAGGAPVIVDPNLKNPWGMSFSGMSPFWVSNQRTGTSTLYRSNADGSTVTKVPLTVTIPPAPGRTVGSPTGQVFNGTSDFAIPTSAGGNGQPARFIFANIDGTIAAWNGDGTTPPGTMAHTVATGATGSVYTGLTLDQTDSGNFLLAANNRSGRIDVYDADFHPTSLDGDFQDPDLQPGISPFKPFNVQVLDDTVYIAYDKVTSTGREHDGIVDAFDTEGHFLQRVVTGGVNAPWGLALAPDDFGPFGGALLVGNFGQGDGKINAYDPDSGAFLGYVTDASGNPLALERLWAIAFGNGTTGGSNVLFFAAGINNEKDGLFGSIRFVGSPNTSSPGGAAAAGLPTPTLASGDVPSTLSTVPGGVPLTPPADGGMPADPPSANLVAALLKAGSLDLASAPGATGMRMPDGSGGTLPNQFLIDQIFLAAKKDDFSVLSSAGQQMAGSGEDGMTMALEQDPSLTV